MHREFGVANSFTLEASFCGPTQGIYKDTHFTQKLLRVSRDLILKGSNNLLAFETYRKAVNNSAKLS